MWFVAEQNRNTNEGCGENLTGESKEQSTLLLLETALGSPPPPPPPPKSPTYSKNDPAQPTLADSLLDVDHNYFKPSSTASDVQQPEPGHSRFATSPASVPSAPRIAREPSRSGSIPVPAPPTLAPPLASQLTASPPRGTQGKPTTSASYWDFDPLGGGSDDAFGDDPQDQGSPNEGPSHPTLGRSSSYQTLSSLSSKWVSSLLGGGPGSPPVASSIGARPALESIYSQGQSASSNRRPSIGQRRNSSLPHESSPTNTTYATEQHVSHAPTPPPSSTQPFYSIQPPTITHSTPFGPASVTHGSSAFAPPVYVPPTGAPGFRGDSYDWDKGFSDELENERRGIAMPKVSSTQRREGDGRGRDRPGLSGSSSGMGSWVPSSRGGWSSGFFGSVRAGQGKAKTPSPSSSVLALGNGNDPKRSSSPSVYSQARGYDGTYESSNRTGDALVKHTGHERESKVLGHHGQGMGDFIEKKLGTLELVGRKASSTPVLSPALAGLVSTSLLNNQLSDMFLQLRSHLPALSRLSKFWTLIYSLDQHGISLNTLYSRCDAHLTRKPAPGEVPGVAKGMLLVVKDAADDGEDEAVFGAWVADGITPNKGKGYSGGGES